MLLDGVCYSAFIQFYRVVLSRTRIMVEPYYCSQSFLDEYCLICRVFSSLGVYRRPCVSPINAPLLIQYVQHHLSKTVDLLSGEGVSTGHTARSSVE